MSVWSSKRILQLRKKGAQGVRVRAAELTPEERKRVEAQFAEARKKMTPGVHRKSA